MSSSPTAPTSTTGSSTSSPSDQSRPPLVACGAIAQPAAASSPAAAGRSTCTRCRRCCTTSPQLIAGEVRRLATELAGRYDEVVVGYADCGTYGALDAVCEELGLRRLPGLHCYDLYAGASRLAPFFDEQPGTYLLTDFLVRSFARTVVHELGLDR